jgi:putative PIN family toxin of toxin-antitoxin system
LLRLALDTNVWISAFLTPGGVCEKLVRAPADGSCRFLTCRSVLGEIDRVMTDKLDLPRPMVDERIRYVISHCLVVEPRKRLAVVPHCEADNRVLECAVEGRASFLVTGDKEHLLPLGRFQGVEIVTPRRMVDLLGL